jgi:hypothetical protein
MTLRKCTLPLPTRWCTKHTRLVVPHNQLEHWWWRKKSVALLKTEPKWSNPQPLTLLMRYHKGRHVTKRQIIDFTVSVSSCHVIPLTQTNVIIPCTFLYHSKGVGHHRSHHIYHPLQILAWSLFIQQANNLNSSGYISSINRTKYLVLNKIMSNSMVQRLS